MLENTKQKTN